MLTALAKTAPGHGLNGRLVSLAAETAVLRHFSSNSGDSKKPSTSATNATPIAKSGAADAISEESLSFKAPEFAPVEHVVRKMVIEADPSIRFTTEERDFHANLVEKQIQDSQQTTRVRAVEAAAARIASAVDKRIQQVMASKLPAKDKYVTDC